MKKCPFCAEEIQDAAIKCKHCSEFLDGRPRAVSSEQGLPWYFRTIFIFIAFCSVGPLALPLIWWHPKISLAWKIGWTVLTMIISYFLYLATMKSISVLMDYYRMLNDLAK